VTAQKGSDEMPKCSRLGCTKEATRHSKVDIGGFYADVWACEDHYKEVMESLKT
jgi:hypothetical protein